MSSVSTENSKSNDHNLSTPKFLTMFSSNLFLRSFVFSGLIYFLLVLGGWPGQAFITVLWIGLLGGMFGAIVYGKIAAQTEAEQGLYFYLKHRLGRFSAFITTLLLFITGNVLLGFIISFLPKYIFSQLVFIAGVRYENRFLLDSSVLLQTPQSIALFGIGVIMAAFLLTSLSKSIFPKIFSYSIILLFLAGMILLLQFGLPSNPDLNSTWNVYYEEVIYKEVVNQARLTGMNNYIFGGVYAFAGLSIVLWFFTMGFENINLNVFYKKRSSVWVNLVSVIIPFLFLFGLYHLFVRNTGFSWMRAQAYLGLINQGNFPIWLTTYAGLFSPTPVFFLLISLFLMITMVSILGVSLISNGVFIIAWAKDGILPEAFLLKNRANEKLGIPFLIVSILYGIGVVISAFSTSISDVVGFIIALQLAQFPILISVFLPALSGNKNGGTKKDGLFTSIAAALVGIVLVFSLVTLMITPVPVGFTPWLGLVVGGIGLFIGVAYYLFLKNKVVSI